MSEIIRKFVLKNAFEFKGSVNTKAVLGLVLRENPKFKLDVPVTLKKIEKSVEEVRKLSHEQIESELKKIDPSLLENKKKRKEKLKLLNNVGEKVVVRIAPSPSGPLHIGHAYGAALNALYAEKYKGKFILRIEDTNPENIYPKAYDLIERDARWLTDVSKVVIQSERLEIYYDYAEKLIEMEKAYVSTEDPDEFRELKNKGKNIPSRDLPLAEQRLRFKKMFSDYAPGEAVLRLKTDLNHKNPAMRDFALMRINDHVHPKTGKKNRVWPLMVLAVAIDDHELGITHVLNGKDHTDNSHKEAMIMECFGWKPLEYAHWGKINFVGMKLSSSETRIAIEQGEYNGWDDIRVPFLPALKKRGYQPGAFKRFAEEIGLSLNDKTVSKDEFWKMINAFNREIVEPEAKRYFLVMEPVKVRIEGLPQRKIELALHPEKENFGTRELKIKQDLYLEKADLLHLEEGKVHRLIDFCNIIKEKEKLKFHSDSYEDYKSGKKGRIIHWLPIEQAIKMKVQMDDGKLMEVMGEDSLSKVPKGAIIQFERHFFASKGDVYSYLHK